MRRTGKNWCCIIMISKKIWHEALLDTAAACAINIPLNYALASLALAYSFTEIGITVLFTVTFTIIAIIRKVFIRLHFEKKYAIE